MGKEVASRRRERHFFESFFNRRQLPCKSISISFISSEETFYFAMRIKKK